MYLIQFDYITFRSLQFSINIFQTLTFDHFQLNQSICVTEN